MDIGTNPYMQAQEMNAARGEYLTTREVKQSSSTTELMKINPNQPKYLEAETLQHGQSGLNPT